MLKTYLKEIFLESKELCSEYNDFPFAAKRLKKYFLKQNYPHQQIEQILVAVKNPRHDTFLETIPHHPKDEQSIFACAWRPSLSKVPPNLHKKYHIIENNLKLSKTLKPRPTVAFRRNYQVKSDTIPNRKERKGISPCGKCEFYPLINSSNLGQNKSKDIQLR